MSSVIGCCFAGSLSSRAPHCQTVSIIPDYNTCAAVKNIRASQISSIEFYGLLYGPLNPLLPSEIVPHEPSPHPVFIVTVNEPQLIGRFVHALRYADTYSGATPMYELPSLEIKFKKFNGRQRQALDLDFNGNGFGSMFHAVMSDLPSYEAEQMHRRVGAVADRVQEIDFYGLKVTDPAQVTQIVQDLQHVDKDAYTGSNSVEDTFGVTLRLQSGGVEEIVFVISPSSVRAQKLPLPGILWFYYKQVQQNIKS